MNARISTALAAAAFGLAALAPGIGQAATIGYHGLCSGGSNGSSAIAAAGHTPIAVATVDAASLRSLDGLLYINCFDVAYAANAALDAAVANGMVLVFHHGFPSSIPLPGAGGLVLTDIYSAPDGSTTPYNVDFPVGSPITTGPGGALTNTSLDGDYFSGYTNRGYAAHGSLPAGSTVLATTPDPAQVVTFAYPYGSGRVVYGSVPIDVFLDGGVSESHRVAAGVKAFEANLLAWAMATPFTTCAAEGYTGSKLNLCRQICEIDQTPTRLTSLIRLYMSAYRSEPPCAD